MLALNYCLVECVISLFWYEIIIILFYVEEAVDMVDYDPTSCHQDTLVSHSITNWFLV